LKRTKESSRLFWFGKNERKYDSNQSLVVQKRMLPAAREGRTRDTVRGGTFKGGPDSNKKGRAENNQKLHRGTIEGRGSNEKKEGCFPGENPASST